MTPLLTEPSDYPVQPPTGTHHGLYCFIRDLAVVNETTKVPFICKSTSVVRDCKVLKSISPNLKSGRYRVRPFYSDYQVYCDMTTDGGGYTYYINSAVQNAITSTSTIKRFCRDFDPIDIVSTSQVCNESEPLQSLYESGVAV
eukprot:sb/3474128/